MTQLTPDQTWQIVKISSITSLVGVVVGWIGQMILSFIKKKIKKGHKHLKKIRKRLIQ